MRLLTRRDLMSEAISVLLFWNGTDFEQADPKGFRDDNQTLVYIDGSAGGIFTRISPRETNINRRIITRRLQSLTKSGYQFSPNLRISTASYKLHEIEGVFDLQQLVKGRVGSVQIQSPDTTVSERLPTSYTRSETADRSPNEMSQDMSLDLRE